MGYFRWARSRIRQFTLVDFSVFKICLVAFTLMVAKLWPDILVLDWYWYAGVFGLSYLWILARMLRRQE